MFSSWKTTIAGIAAILTALGAAGTDFANGTPVNFGVLVPSILVGIGIILAKDASKDATKAVAK